jgi:hypothetical protein
MGAVSRRKIIALGAIGGAGALMPPLFRERGFGAPSVCAVPPLGVEALLRAAPASDPSSTETLDVLFPGLRFDLESVGLLPVAFLVSNFTDHTIRAFSTQWMLVSSGETKQFIVHYYFHRRSAARGRMHWGSKGNHTRVTAKVPAIQAHETRLVTPFFNWKSDYYKNHRIPTWHTLLAQRARPQVELENLRNTAVTMRLVGAVTRSFWGIGPKGKELARIIYISRLAEYDEAAESLAYVSSGASSEQVKGRLQYHASGLAFNIRPESDLYCRVRQRQAKVLLRRLKYARWDQFLRTLEYFKKPSVSKCADSIG